MTPDVPKCGAVWTGTRPCTQMIGIPRTLFPDRDEYTIPKDPGKTVFPLAYLSQQYYVLGTTRTRKDNIKGTIIWFKETFNVFHTILKTVKKTKFKSSSFDARTFEPRHDKTNKMSVRPAKTKISLGIRPVWSESLLSAWRMLGYLATQWAHNKDSDQTGRMPRLIWVFAGRTLILLIRSCRGSIVHYAYKWARLLYWIWLCKTAHTHYNISFSCA